MKKISFTLIIISLITIAFLLIINEIVISIRINELSANLQDIDRKEGSIDNIGLVATYEIHKKLFENRLTQDQADAIEQRINSLVILEKDKPPQFDLLYSIASFPALKVINFNRMVLGKTPLTYYHDEVSGYLDMDMAYYYERNFHFKRAIELYDKSLTNRNLNNSLRAGILLHHGYCYALSGLNEKARRNYLTVIEKYSQESSAITATILLRYLEGFKLARERVMKSKDDPLLRSQNLVNLLSYRQALSILETTEREAKPGDLDLTRIKYYKARCYTGMGNTQKAVENYLQVITSSPSSQYARYSNRKLFIIGSSGREETIQKISIGFNKKLEDPVLSQMIENREETPAPVNIQEGLIKIDIPSDLKAKVSQIISNNKEPLLKKSKFYIILTSDGNTFKGTLIKEADDYIALMTSIGRIDVKKDRVTKITEK